MKRKLIYVALAVIVLNGILLVSLLDVALANNSVEAVRFPAVLLIAAIAEGEAVIVLVNGRLSARAAEKRRRKEYHRTFARKGKATSARWLTGLIARCSWLAM